MARARSPAVPQREIALGNGKRVTVYVTSGPCSASGFMADVHARLLSLRAPWLDDASHMVQMEQAGEVSRLLLRHVGS